ncbi:hypothetical protein MJG53_015496 [Ovis ammon polii x Ovis aries]|uniref:Uncharacterized protein n=1 Tax=Ovis ammon polii x Ovis aries TaxID=2918886 RepID=A0ACB9UFM6_9CETA|nr:hypothetical protein MJG53_015496 [Ovis ammon polii x Ovis aries]
MATLQLPDLSPRWSCGPGLGAVQKDVPMPASYCGGPVENEEGPGGLSCAEKPPDGGCESPLYPGKAPCCENVSVVSEHPSTLPGCGQGPPNTFMHTDKQRLCGHRPHFLDINNTVMVFITSSASPIATREAFKDGSHHGAVPKTENIEISSVAAEVPEAVSLELGEGHDEAGRTEHTVGQPGAATYLLSQPDPVGHSPELQLPAGNVTQDATPQGPRYWGFVRIEQGPNLVVNLGSAFMVKEGRLTRKVQDFMGAGYTGVRPRGDGQYIGDAQ